MLLLIISLFVVSTLAAKKRSAAELAATGDPQLDSILVRLNSRIEWYIAQGVGKLDLNVDVLGNSYNQNHRWWTPLFQDLLPFDARPNGKTDLQAKCKVSYQAPCDLYVTPLTLASDNRRRSQKILKELYPILLPVYDFRLMQDKYEGQGFILPFSTEGLRRYNYSLADSVHSLTSEDSILILSFEPKRPHHGLLRGDAVIDLRKMLPQEFRLQGSIDFGKMKDTLRFDLSNGQWIITHSSIDLQYKYGKTRGYNHYDCDYSTKQLLSEKAQNASPTNYNLSDVYQTLTSDFIPTNKAKVQSDTLAEPGSKSHTFFKKLPQRIVSSSDFEALGTDVRIYGPLNPAFVGYDKINGVTLRERMRFRHLFANGQSIKIYPEVGYAFRPKAFRYKFDTEWTYNAKRRASLSIKLQNGSTGFSSRFKNDVNHTIEQYINRLNLRPSHMIYPDHNHHEELSFDSLGLRYFNRYEFMIENTIEIANGLRFYLGANYSIRKPVKHGVYAYVQEIADATIDKRYLDMNPYLRLVWTPGQYYYYDNEQKLYLNSRWPTFALEFGQGVKNVLKSRANYTRIEIDAHQFIPIGNSRSLSWHCGSGGFIKQDEEYFVNYTYFSRSQYPTSWNRRNSSGAFALLDDFWYSSSPSYAQAHIMYESPFLLLHNWRLVSKYVIKERVYASTLWAQGKHPYGELGYGIGNNYFNASVFCGLFFGKHPFDFGVKFSLELDRHL